MAKVHPEIAAGLVMPLKTPGIDYSDIPLQFWGKVSAICRSHADCLDLSYWFGDEDFCPYLPVLLVIPDPKGGVHYNQITGNGLTEVWELRDCAVGIWETITNRLEKTGRIFDFDAAREKHGLMRRENVDQAVREALWDRAQKHKANPVTDPGRQPQYANPTNKTVFAEHVPPSEEGIV